MAKTRRPLTEEEREARRAAQRELVRASIEQLRTSDGWKAYLKARRRLPSYSWRNILLILSPTTHRDAGRRVPHVARSRLLRAQAPRRRARGGVGDPDLGPLRAQPQADAGVARRRRRPRRAAPRHATSSSTSSPRTRCKNCRPRRPPAPLEAPIAEIRGDSHHELLPRLAQLSAELGYTFTVGDAGRPTASATPRPRRSSSPSAWTPTAAWSPGSTSSRTRSSPRTRTRPSSPTPKAS